MRSTLMMLALIVLACIPPTVPDSHDEVDRTVCWWDTNTSQWLSEYTIDGLCQFTATPDYK